MNYSLAIISPSFVLSWDSDLAPRYFIIVGFVSPGWLLQSHVHLFKPFIFGMKELWESFSPLTMVLLCNLYHSRAHAYYTCIIIQFTNCKCFTVYIYSMFVTDTELHDAALNWHKKFVFGFVFSEWTEAGADVLLPFAQQWRSSIAAAAKRYSRYWWHSIQCCTLPKKNKKTCHIHSDNWCYLKHLWCFF